MNLPNLTSQQYRRFELHLAYARCNGAALYNAQAPATIVQGDDEVNATIGHEHSNGYTPLAHLPHCKQHYSTGAQVMTPLSAL